MGEEKRSDTGKEQESGFPKISAIHVIIAVAVIVLVVIFIAKFGFGTDLISPSSGEMSILKKPVTPVHQVVQTFEVRPTVSFRPEVLCPSNQSLCGNTCTNRMTDPDNCAFCGKVCPSYNFTDRKCISAKCSNPCLAGHYDCNQNIADGCETDLSDKENCGSCGKACASGWFCFMGKCATGGGGPGTVTQSPNNF